MHQTAVIQLRNKAHPESVTEPLQVDPAIDTASLTSYLNACLGAAAEYIFYYQNTRLTKDVAALIEKHALDVESTVVIDYLSTEDLAEDLRIPCDDVVTDLLWFRKRLYARLYDGSLLEYGLCTEEKAPRRHEKTAGIACDRNMYGVVCGAVVDFETGEPVLKNTHENSLFIATHGDMIALGATKKKIELFLLGSRGDASSEGCRTEGVYAEDSYRGVRLTGDAVYWIESLDVVVRYDLGTGKKDTFYTRLTVTSITVVDGTIFCTTSNNVLVKIENKTVQSYDVSVRSVDQLIAYQNVLILVSQHCIVSLDRTTMEERAYLSFDEQVNAAALGDGKLFVGNGCRISGYSLSRLV